MGAGTLVEEDIRHKGADGKLRTIENPIRPIKTLHRMIFLLVFVLLPA